MSSVWSMPAVLAVGGDGSIEDSWGPLLNRYPVLALGW